MIQPSFTTVTNESPVASRPTHQPRGDIRPTSRPSIHQTADSSIAKVDINTLIPSEGRINITRLPPQNIPPYPYPTVQPHWPSTNLSGPGGYTDPDAPVKLQLGLGFGLGFGIPLALLGAFGAYKLYRGLSRPAQETQATVAAPKSKPDQKPAVPNVEIELDLIDLEAQPVSQAQALDAHDDVHERLL